MTDLQSSSVDYTTLEVKGAQGCNEKSFLALLGVVRVPRLFGKRE